MCVITSVHGHKVYTADEINCVCIDFDYWGTPTTLQIPYAKYRPESLEILCDRDVYTGLTEILAHDEWISSRFIHMGGPIPPVPDHELQKKLEAFKKDGTSRRNTNILIKCNSPAAKLCRNLGVPGVPKGYFDLGNVYEMAIIWLESDTIDMVDPTANYYPERRIGGNNPNGRFYSVCRNVYWSSSEFADDFAWCVTHGGAVGSSAKINAYGVVPSRTVQIAESAVNTPVINKPEPETKLEQYYPKTTQEGADIAEYVFGFTDGGVTISGGVRRTFNSMSEVVEFVKKFFCRRKFKIVAETERPNIFVSFSLLGTTKGTKRHCINVLVNSQEIRVEIYRMGPRKYISDKIEDTMWLFRTILRSGNAKTNNHSDMVDIDRELDDCLTDLK